MRIPYRARRLLRRMTVRRAVLGDAHEKWSARLHVALPIVGFVVGGVMIVYAREAGRDWLGALRYASHGLMPWIVWTLLLGWMRRNAGEYHPPVGDRPLDPTRKKLALAMFVLFVLIATPVPFRPVL